MLRTLKGKFSVVYIALVCLIALLGATSVVNLLRLERSVNGLMTRNYRSISSASEMMYALDSQEKALITYLTMDETAGMSEFYESGRQFQSAYDVDAHNVTENGEQAVVNKIHDGYGSFQQMFATLVSIKSRQGLPAAQAYYTGTVAPGLSDIRGQIRSLVQIDQDAMFRSKDTASAGAKYSTYFLLWVTLTLVVGGFLVSHYFVNRFLRPLRQLTDGISKVRAGGLDLQLDIRTTDETGRLAAEFNEMTRRLSVYEKSTMGTLLSERNKSVAIVKSISDPLIVLDGRFRILLLNNASEQYFSIGESTAVGRHFLEAIHSGELFDIISRNAESGGARSEKILRFPGDDYFNVVVTRIVDPDQHVTGFILLMQNVTKLKELEQMKTDFLATVSHEFKTPLTSILMGASMLQNGSLGPLTDDQQEIVRTIAEDGDRLSEFVGELLEISRIEAGKSIYHFKPCSVAAIAENSCRQFADAAAARQVRLENRLGRELPDVLADFEKITWVLNNLIGNALKYTGAGDCVTLTAEPKGDWLEVSVSDTGEGIPADYLERIFDRFVQVKGRDIEMRGTGLGLSIARDIVTAHHGTIRAESELERGSTFRFTLPIWKNGASGAPGGNQTT